MQEAEALGKDVFLIGLGDVQGKPINFKDAATFIESMLLLVLGKL